MDETLPYAFYENSSASNHVPRELDSHVMYPETSGKLCSSLPKILSFFAVSVLPEGGEGGWAPGEHNSLFPLDLIISDSLLRLLLPAYWSLVFKGVRHNYVDQSKCF